MKKFIIVLLMGFLLLRGCKTDFSLADYFIGTLKVYSLDSTAQSVDLGFAYITDKENCSAKVGESMTLNSVEPLLVLQKLSAKIVSTEVLEDGTEVIYAVSNIVPKSVSLNNKKVNLQLANTKDGVVIGWPLIIGSF